MASPLLLTLILIAGSLQNFSDPLNSCPRIDINEIIDNIRDVISRLPDIIAGLDWANVLERIRDFIQNLDIREILERIREIAAQIPGAVPGVIEGIIERLPAILERIPEIIDQLPDNVREIVDRVLAAVAGIRDRLPEVIEQIRETLERPEVRETIARIVERVRNFLDRADWESIVADLPDNACALVDRLPEIIERLPELVRELIDDLDIPDWISDRIPEFDREEGTRTHISRYPSIVQVEIRVCSLWVQMCTGNIVNNLYILTSAHCFYGPLYETNRRRIKAGANSRGGDGSIYEIGNVYNHPNFGDNFLDSDVALVRSQRVINYNINVAPIGIVSQGAFFGAGIPVTHVSFGSTAEGRTFTNRYLYEKTLYVVGNAQCSNQLLLPITSSMFCAGASRSGGRMTDIRDGGAPVYYNGAVAGIVSYGRFIGPDHAPIVLTNIGHYTNWIVSTAV